MIPVFRPSYGKEEWEALREPLESGWVGLGPKTREFETTFARYVGAEHAIAVNSATAALHLALKVLDVEGGEVITTSMTFVSTNHVILMCGAVPVFADIEEDTLNIRVDEIERLISSRTRAIMIVDYGGHPCDLDPIMELGRKHGIPVVEDASHGCGAKYKGRPVGSIADITCFSFHAVKNLATGDGGMVTTNRSELVPRLNRLRWLGITKDTWSRSEGKYAWYYDVAELGFKYHMNDLTAAIGLVQLGKLDAMNDKRHAHVDAYNAAFADLPWLDRPVVKEYASSATHNYVIKADDRDALMAHLASAGIATGMHYYPNHLYEMYQPFRRPLPITERVWKKLVTLPLFPDLKQEEHALIVEHVREFQPHAGDKH